MTPRASAGAVLRGAALGATPGRHPLPPPADPEQRWWRAVALGGQGRHAAAGAELVRPELAPGGGAPPALASLALSTRASLLRQLGGHHLARPLDARALVLAGHRTDRAAATARADALVGLAADALGPGRVRLAHRLLAAAADELARADGRCRVRWGWVAAETALCADDPAAAAGHAATALALALEGPSVRHRVKSALVLAAATGGLERAATARAEAAEHGLVPLEWAAAMLLVALPPPRSRTPDGGDPALVVTTARAIIALRGGVLPGSPPPLDLDRSRSRTAGGPVPG